MATLIIIIHLMVVIAMIIVVLLQKSEGGALGIGGGSGGGFMSGRAQTNLLTRATAILAGVFFLTSIALSIIANMSRQPTSVFDDAARQPGQTQPATPGEGGPSLFDQLQRMDEGGAAPQTPAPQTPGGAQSPAPGSPPSPPLPGN